MCVYRSEPTVSIKLTSSDDCLCDQIHCEHSEEQMLNNANSADSAGKIVNSAGGVKKMCKLCK